MRSTSGWIWSQGNASPRDEVSRAFEARGDDHDQSWTGSLGTASAFDNIMDQAACQRGRHDGQAARHLDVELPVVHAFDFGDWERMAKNVDKANEGNESRGKGNCRSVEALWLTHPGPA